MRLKDYYQRKIQLSTSLYTTPAFFFTSLPFVSIPLNQTSAFSVEFFFLNVVAFDVLSASSFLSSIAVFDFIQLFIGNFNSLLG